MKKIQVKLPNAALYLQVALADRASIITYSPAFGLETIEDIQSFKKKVAMLIEKQSKKKKKKNQMNFF